MNQYPISTKALTWLEDTLSDRFGNKWALLRKGNTIEMKLEGDDNRIIFSELSNSLTEANSHQAYTVWDCVQEGWEPVLGRLVPAPGFSELRTPLIERKNKDYFIKYDILGLTYWMLARVEEIGRSDLDAHGRFAATSSHAFKYGYLERPIVDEWMHILSQVIRETWKGIKLKNRKFEVIVSCDVDRPFAYDGTVRQMIRGGIGDILKRRSLRLAIKNTYARCKAISSDWNYDPYYQGIEYIMNINEGKNRKAIFFFMSLNSDLEMDNIISLNEKRLTEVLRDIDNRGHRIGIHPGYKTYNDKNNFRLSVQKLKKKLERENINQEITIGRQHYLRWKTPDTARMYEENKVFSDSTLGYADMPGFRCGTCIRYNFFDAEEQMPMNLSEQPLIVMECSIISDKYMGLKASRKAQDKMINLKEICKKVGGEFTILWHNSSLNTKKEKEIYREICS